MVTKHKSWWYQCNWYFFASFSNQWHQRWSLILATTKHTWPFWKKYTLSLLLCPFNEWSKAKWLKTCFVVEINLLTFFYNTLLTFFLQLRQLYIMDFSMNCKKRFLIIMARNMLPSVTKIPFTESATALPHPYSSWSAIVFDPYIVRCFSSLVSYFFRPF